MGNLRAAAIAEVKSRTKDQRLAAQRLAREIVEGMIGGHMRSHITALSAKEVIFSLAAELYQLQTAREQLQDIASPPPRFKDMPPNSIAEGKQHLAAGLRFALLVLDGVPEGEALDRA